DLLCAFLLPSISTQLQDRIRRGTCTHHHLSSLLPFRGRLGSGLFLGPTFPLFCHPERSRGICCAPFSCHRFLHSSRIGYAEEPALTTTCLLSCHFAEDLVAASS